MRTQSILKVKPLLFETYLSMINGSVGSQQFQHSYAEVNGAKQDITEGGSLSCAFFVSNLLKMFDLCESVHATVSGTIRDLENSDWYQIPAARPGCVVVWAHAKEARDHSHRHVGFALDRDRAISNSSQLKTPVIHPIASGNEVESFYWHDKLETVTI